MLYFPIFLLLFFFLPENPRFHFIVSFTFKRNFFLSFFFFKRNFFNYSFGVGPSFFLKKLINLFTYGCAGSSLLCELFSHCGRWELLSKWGPQASHRGSFSCC